jgi:hypothetical protein
MRKSKKNAAEKALTTVASFITVQPNAVTPSGYTARFGCTKSVLHQQLDTMPQTEEAFA